MQCNDLILHTYGMLKNVYPIRLPKFDPYGIFYPLIRIFDD